jgi:hypothetical protein
MPIIYQASSLQMEWCLACHREPERFVRPVDKVFDMAWRQENTTPEQLAEGVQLKSQYKIQGRKILESCSTCHR